MEWSHWQPTYQAIAKRLGLDPEKDRQATELLTQLLKDTSPNMLLGRLKESIQGQNVVVCGAGPSLDKHLLQIQKSHDWREGVLVAADGAADGMMHFGLKPDVIVTDLDGNRGALQRLIEDGAIAIVHAHGDNMDLVRQTVPTLPPVLGSTQVEPTNRVFLWGGFTDGDRACYVTAEYEPSMILLAGMDFGDYVGRWSKPDGRGVHPAVETKREKLRIGEGLLRGLIASSDIKFTRL